VLYFAICIKLLDYITLFTLVHLRPLGGVIFDVVIFFITQFYHLSLYDKKGDKFLFLDQDCIFNPSSVFFPRMAKGGVC
jgi:hypothetical protein